MNPNYVHTITLYHHQAGTWIRTVLHNCFYHAQMTVSQDGAQARVSNTYTVRIPLSEAGTGFAVSKNDLVIYGECTDEISQEKGHRAAEILTAHKPDAFLVTAFADNTSHLMDKHYRLGG